MADAGSCGGSATNGAEGEIQEWRGEFGEQGHDRSQRDGARELECERRESNPDPLRDRILSPARLPVPPLPHRYLADSTAIGSGDKIVTTAGGRLAGDERLGA